MRILHLSTLYPPHVMGGAELSVAMLAEAQKTLGHEVFAACTTPGAAVRELQHEISVFRMPHESAFWIEDWLSYPKLQRAWRKFSHQFNHRLKRHFQGVLDEVRPDVLHTHSLVDVTTLVWPAAAARGIPVVHTLRDYDLICASASLYHDGQPCGLGCRLLTAHKPVHHLDVDAVVGVSRLTLDEHLHRGLFAHVPPQDRRVIWNAATVKGVPDNYKRQAREGKIFTFGFMGRITDEKGVWTLIDAARRLPQTECRILIAGRAPGGIGEFQRLSTGLPIEFVGWIEPKAFFESIDVLIVPSIWAEPLPRTILESYRMGIPVIGARSGGIPEVMGSDASDWLFLPGDVNALAAQMARVLAGGRNALPDADILKQKVADCEPGLVARRYLNLYESVLQRRRLALIDPLARSV